MRRPRRGRARPGWVAYGNRPGRRYEYLESGWWVLHCGHPTALYPYYAETPEGKMILHPQTKRGFTLLVDAQAHVESLVAEREASTERKFQGVGEAILEAAWEGTVRFAREVEE